MCLEEPIVNKHIKTSDASTFELSAMTNSCSALLKKHKKMAEK